jgi:hypothetical protein
MWNQSTDEYSAWAGEEGANYITVSGHTVPMPDSGYDLNWQFTLNNAWPEVEDCIDFGVFAKDDQDAVSGWDYDNTDASFSLIPAAKPITYTVQQDDLFYVKLNLQNDDPDSSYDVSFQVVDKNGATTQTKYHALIFPDFDAISKNSLRVRAGRWAQLTIIFDPQETADLETLSEMGIKLSYLVQATQIEELVEIGFGGYTTATATGFDITEDAYSFANWELTPGKCYGMATTSIHYFTGELSLPEQIENVYSLTINEAESHINDYQDSTLNSLLATWTSLFGNNKLTSSEYQGIVDILGNEKEPMLVILDGATDKKAKAHAVALYGIVETANSAYLIIYDNNYPFNALSSGPLPYMRYDFASEQLEYETYTRFKIVRAHEKWHEWIKAEIFSPAELRVYDSEGRVTGLVDGQVRNQIPNSEYFDDIVMIWYPSGTCHYEVIGTSDGTYGLNITYIGDEEGNTLTAVDIPTAPGTMHQYVVDWSVLSQGEEGVTVNVDTDGDGITDYTFNSDSELTGDEFLPPSGFCFVATATYGTPMASEVQILRDFRDQCLLTTPVGHALTNLYYKFSPPIAEFITEHPRLKPVVRAGLVPAVAISTVAVNTGPKEKAVTLGFLVLVSVGVAVWVTRKRRRRTEYN